MVFAWAVIGHGNARKSSTIRALTGVSRIQERWLVSFLRGAVEGAPSTPHVYVHPTGLQEADLQPPEFIALVRNTRVRHTIFALRRHAIGDRPDALAYLNEMRAARWEILGTALLGGAVDEPLPGYTSTLIRDARNMPSNEVAARLRGEWRIA